MKKILLVALLLLAAGCNKQTEPVSTVQNQPPIETTKKSNPINKNTMSTNLQTDLESTYNKFRKAILDKDFTTFSSLFEPAKESEVTEDKFSMASDVLLDFYPTLESVKFIKAIQNGDWAGYYMQAELDDPNYTTVDVIKFHKSGGVWKINGSISGSSFPKDSTTTTIESEMKNSEALQLPTK